MDKARGKGSCSVALYSEYKKQQIGKVRVGSQVEKYEDPPFLEVREVLRVMTFLAPDCCGPG